MDNYIKRLQNKTLEYLTLNRELIYHYSNTIKELKNTNNSEEYKKEYIKQYRNEIKNILLINYKELKKFYL